MIIMLTGGARSGKSSHALKLAEAHKGRKIFIATAEAFDEEMRQRIKLHQEERSSLGWSSVVEEPMELARALDAIEEADVVLVDCLTLWVSNLMHRQRDVQAEGRTLVEALKRAQKRVRLLLIVTNEVGLGIVPENELARRFRDEAGTLNRFMAEASDEVYFMVSGLAIKAKP